MQSFTLLGEDALAKPGDRVGRLKLYAQGANRAVEGVAGADPPL